MQELAIDLFAGGGGASEAIRAVLGRDPDIAVNHDREAVALHAANHPATRHLCEDIRRVDIPALLAEYGGRRVGLLWASPDCKHHSKARGGKPKDKNIRGLAWEVVRWVAAIKRATGRAPRMVALENVEEFADWSPLHRYGKRAGTVQKNRKRETFRLWAEQLASLGGKVEWRELIACDYGAPTTRKRLFLICRFDGGAIRWPAPTHSKAGGADGGDLFDRPLQPWRSAAEIIDWSRPIPSIFDRKKELVPKTKARIAKGIRRYVVEAARPFIVPVTHAKGRAVPSIDEPLRTVTSAHRGEFSLVAPTIVPRYGERPGQEPRARSIAEPYPTVVPDGNGGELAAEIAA